VNRGIYWDDWALSGLPPGDVLKVFTELGQPIGGYVFAV
jgi:hypothetical protein